MTKYVYTSWFMNPAVAPDDPDSEWPACFVVEGTTESSAKDWGDRLARRYAADNRQGFLRSSIETLEESTLPGTDLLPVIREGQDADDGEIGW